MYLNLVIIEKYCKAKMVEINKKIKNPELIKPKQP